MRVVKAGFVLGALLACQDPRPSKGETADCAAVLLEPQERRILRFTADGEPKDPLPCPRPYCICGGGKSLATYDEAGDLRIAFKSGQEVTIPGGRCTQALFGCGDVVALHDQARLTVYSASGAYQGETFDVPLAEDEQISSIGYRQDALWVTASECTHDDTRPPTRRIALLGDPSRFDREVEDDGEVVGLFRQAEDGRAMVVVGERETALPPQVPFEALRGGTLVGEWVYASLSDGNLIAIPPGAEPFVVRRPPRSALVTTDAGPIRISRDGTTRRIHHTGEDVVWRREAGKDLSGAPLPPDARADGVKVSVWRSKLAFLERLRLPTCEVEDRVHLADIATGDIRTLRAGKRMRTHAVWAHGTLHIVEADVTPRFFSLRD